MLYQISTRLKSLIVKDNWQSDRSLLYLKLDPNLSPDNEYKSDDIHVDVPKLNQPRYYFKSSMGSSNLSNIATGFSQSSSYGNILNSDDYICSKQYDSEYIYMLFRTHLYKVPSCVVNHGCLSLSEMSIYTLLDLTNVNHTYINFEVRGWCVYFLTTQGLLRVNTNDYQHQIIDLSICKPDGPVVFDPYSDYGPDQFAYKDVIYYTIGTLLVHVEVLQNGEFECKETQTPTQDIVDLQVLGSELVILQNTDDGNQWLRYLNLDHRSAKPHLSVNGTIPLKIKPFEGRFKGFKMNENVIGLFNDTQLVFKNHGIWPYKQEYAIYNRISSLPKLTKLTHRIVDFDLYRLDHYWIYTERTEVEESDELVAHISLYNIHS